MQHSCAIVYAVNSVKCSWFVETRKRLLNGYIMKVKKKKKMMQS